jgi:hypothetical protein
MRKALAGLALSLAGTFALATESHATVISYDVSNIGGNTWVYTYAVTNNNGPGGAAISAFDVIFGSTLFANLRVTALPLGWIGAPLQPEPPPIDDDGLFIGLTLPFLGFGVEHGETLGGFQVRFDFLGAGTPASQIFQILHPWRLFPIEMGQTVRVAVTEPGALALFAVAAGLFGVVLLRRRRLAARL